MAAACDLGGGRDGGINKEVAHITNAGLFTPLNSVYFL